MLKQLESTALVEHSAAIELVELVDPTALTIAIPLGIFQRIAVPLSQLEHERASSPRT